jgi:hypothetical protein
MPRASFPGTAASIRDFGGFRPADKGYGFPDDERDGVGAGHSAEAGRTPAGGAAIEAVHLTVPAALEYVRIVRLTASGVASRLGFDVDEIENLRVAIDELANTAIEFAPGGPLDITFVARGGQLWVEGRTAVGTATEVLMEDLTAQILKAVVDEYDVAVSDGHLVFSCARRLPAI